MRLRGCSLVVLAVASPRRRRRAPRRRRAASTCTAATAPPATGRTARVRRVPTARIGGGPRATRGAAGLGPSLRGVGALAADFYLRTGLHAAGARRPAAAPLAAAARPAADRRARRLRRVARPRAGRPDPAPGARQPLARASTCSRALRRLPPGRRGGRIRHGRRAAPARRRDADQIAEAVRIGPYVMPASRRRRSRTAQLDSIVRYVAIHEASGRPRRLVARPPRPGARRARHLVHRGARARRASAS